MLGDGEERFLFAGADHFAGAKWEENASARSARNDREWSGGMNEEMRTHHVSVGLTEGSGS